MRAYFAACAILVAACSSSSKSEPAAPSPHTDESEPQAAPATSPATSRVFGKSPALDGAPVAVNDVMQNAESYLGKTIKCTGTITRVCQKAGCWMELAPKADAPGLRVPMAGHSFFLPPDVVGHEAVVEGALSARALSNAEREHLVSEGLKAEGALSLAATGVVVQ